MATSAQRIVTRYKAARSSPAGVGTDLLTVAVRQVDDAYRATLKYVIRDQNPEAYFDSISYLLEGQIKKYRHWVDELRRLEFPLSQRGR